VNERRIQIRRAEPTDACAIAAVHIRSWQWAYRGQLPDEFLDQLPSGLEQRTLGWERTLSTHPERQVWVAENDETIVGFAATRPCGDEGAPEQAGEVSAIYLDLDWAGKGLGQALLRAAVQGLRAQGFTHATLWVLKSNARARRFYETAGWQADGATKVENRPGLELREVRYRIDFQ
jgi:GNAT superfamily N-acetyltransferase